MEMKRRKKSVRGICRQKNQLTTPSEVLTFKGLVPSVFVEYELSAEKTILSIHRIPFQKKLICEHLPDHFSGYETEEEFSQALQKSKYIRGELAHFFHLDHF